MNRTERTALINEGKTIIERTDEDSWRLAEIVRDLHDDGMTYREIANELGWKNPATPKGYEEALVCRDKHDRFSEALLFGSMSDDRAAAVAAVAEAEGISPHTAKTRQSAKEIAAAISDLPEEEKEAVARELAQDATVRSEAVKADNKELGQKKAAARQEGRNINPNPSTGLDGIGLVHDLKAVEREVAELALNTKEQSEEVQELVGLSVTAIKAQLDMLQSKAEGYDWDESMKELT